nr:hypothetical protein [Tanacetum cinerariifolium]
MTRYDNHDGDQHETSNPSQPIPLPTSQLPHTVSSIKLPILKKGEYDIWAMKMEHYLCHTDYPIWQVIQNGNGPVSVIIDTNGMIKVLPPKTTEEVMAKERERKARTTLLMALLEDHLAEFYKMADAKDMWEAIKSRFSGNDESKKMQKYLLKQQFEGFFVSSLEGLHKGYDRFQTFLSQLKIHGAGVSHEDANQKFLRSLPSSWSQVALIMRTKPRLDTLSFDDLYNNLRVFERDIKGTTSSSSSNTRNVAFVSVDNTNDVSTAYSVSFPSVSKSQKEGSASYTDEVIHSFFSNQSSAPQLDSNDLEQINDDDLEEMDFDFHEDQKVSQKDRQKITNQDSRRRDGGYNGNKARENSRRPTSQDDSKALVTIDGEAVDWFRHVEEDTQNFAMTTYSCSNSSFDTEVQSCSKTCSESYARLKKFDSDSSVETTTSMSAPIDNAPKVVSEPKVWTDAPIIEEYESDSDDDSGSNVQEYIEKPSFAFTDSIKHVKTPRENVKETGTPNHYPKIKKQDRHSYTRKGLGYARKSCFVCGSFSHLIRDCDFHEKRMAKQAALPKSKEHGTGQQPHRPVWNNVKPINHQNKFVPSAVLTKIGKIPVNATKQNFSRQAALTNTDSKVNTARPFVNETRPIRCFYKSHSPHKRPFHYKTTQRNTFATHKVNTVNTSLSAVKGNGDTAVKASAEFKDGFVAFGGSNGKITGEGKIKARRLKGIKREYSNARTLQKNGVAEIKNMTLIEADRTMVYNLETKRVEENLHINFLENKPNVIGKGHAWMFDHDYLTNSMNYEPVSLENQANKSACPKEANHSAGTEANDDQDANSEEIDLHDEHFILPIWSAYSTPVKSSRDKIGKNEKPVSPVEKIFQEELKKLKRQDKEANDVARKEATHETQDVNTNSANLLNVVSTPVSVVGPSRALNDDEPSYPDDPSMPHLEDIYASPSAGIFTNSSYNDKGVVTNFNNFETTMNVSPTPTTRIHTIHPKTQILRDPLLAIQIRNLPFGKKAIRTKWVYRNKKDERGVVVRNKAHLVAQGYRQKEGIGYDEVFAFVARIKAISIFLAFASYMGFIVYQMDVKSAFLYETIDDEVYVTHQPRFVDPKFPNKVYKVYVDDIIFGSTKKSWCDEFEELMKNRFQMSYMGEVTLFLRLQVKQKEDGIFTSQDKYVAEILKKFDFLSVKTASIPIETQKPLVKDEEAIDVDVHLYRSMIGSLIYLTALGLTLCLQYVLILDFRDAYEKKLIQVLKIHTDDDVADLLKKAFNVSSKGLASLKQTALGKDESNPLIVNSLLKTIWSSMHHIIEMKYWLFQSKRLLNFDRKDLEALWKLVKERFETTEPKNFLDDFFLNNFKIMFEKPNVKANQMLDNVRLEFEEESEMSLELLRLVKRQLNEGYGQE